MQKKYPEFEKKNIFNYYLTLNILYLIKIGYTYS